MRIDQKPLPQYSRVLLYGPPGSGKSTLAALLAEEGFHLDWFTLDNDSDILRKLSPEAQARVEFFDIPDSAAFPVAAATMLQVMKVQHGAICHAHGSFNCALCKTKAPNDLTQFDFRNYPSNRILVIDTGTQLGRSILSYLVKDKPVDYKPERDDWGGLRKHTEFFASQFQGFRGNLIIICHAVDVGDDKTVQLVPDFGSKGMSASFMGKFSHGIYTVVENKKHKAFSSSTALVGVQTRSRTDFKIESLPTPSLAPIFAPFLGAAPAPVPEIPTKPEPAPVSSNAALLAKLKGGK